MLMTIGTWLDSPRHVLDSFGKLNGALGRAMGMGGTAKLSALRSNM